MSIRSVGAAIAFGVVACAPLAADDKWESTLFDSDDGVRTPNQLLHGQVQTHDIQGPAAAMGDQDFMLVASKAGHSYEVRVFSTNTCIRAATDGCVNLARVNEAGTILTSGITPDVSSGSGTYGWIAVRWIAPADALEYIRVSGYVGVAATANDQYDIQMLDTTYLVPRWNTSGTQVTVLLIQNGSSVPATGSILFHDAAGGLVHTQPLSVPARGLQVFSTGSVPALAGGSGSAAIAHDGTYGALAGKAVALEPATGFTFDTAIAAIPH